MAKIKSFTSVEQSKKLAEILPLESADMCCFKNQNGSISCYAFPFSQGNKAANPIPCWSLASLLGILTDYTLQTNTDGTVFVVCDSKKPMISDAYDNPVDACYELIIKLNELNTHIIDADKLLEFVEVGMRHSKLLAGTEPVNQNGEYDVVSDVIRRMDLFTYNQLKLIRDYIIENRV